MNRFTEKIDINLPNKYIVLGAMDEFCQALNKFGQLEDIEDELGIDLITLFKAFKNGGVYRKGKKIYNTLFQPIIQCNYHKKYVIYLNNVDDHETELKLIDYGKTWALTKEELEK